MKKCVARLTLALRIVNRLEHRMREITHCCVAGYGRRPACGEVHEEEVVQFVSVAIAGRCEIPVLIGGLCVRACTKIKPR